MEYIELVAFINLSRSVFFVAVISWADYSNWKCPYCSENLKIFNRKIFKKIKMESKFFCPNCHQGLKRKLHYYYSTKQIILGMIIFFIMLIFVLLKAKGIAPVFMELFLNGFYVVALVYIYKEIKIKRLKKGQKTGA